MEVLGVLLGDGRGFGFVFDLEQFGEHLLRRHAFRVSHCVHRGIGAFRHELQFEPIAATVALDDAQHLPIAEVVEERAAVDANLAYEQLIDVVGVNQFFPLLPSCFAAFAASEPGRW